MSFRFAKQTRLYGNLTPESEASRLLSDISVKTATDLLTESNPVVVVPALQLFLTCMYTMSNDDGSDDDRGNLDSNPELLMQAMERMSILFDCVRRLGPDEASLLCQILPKVLFDFFPAADVVNRVISEFISPGQPHQVRLNWVGISSLLCRSVGLMASNISSGLKCPEFKPINH